MIGKKDLGGKRLTAVQKIKVVLEMKELWEVPNQRVLGCWEALCLRIQSKFINLLTKNGFSKWKDKIEMVGAILILFFVRISQEEEV